MSRVLKILHAADLHLDSAFEGLGAARAALRRSEQRELLRRIFALAEERRADLVLLAGDVFDYSAGAYAETVAEVRAAFSRCRAPVLVAPGNHDSYRAASPWAGEGFGENVHIFKKNEIDCVELPGLGVRVWGAAFTDSTAPPPLRGFSAERRAGTLDIGVFHGDTRKPDSRYGAVTGDDIAASGLHYLALGHVHTRTELGKCGGTYYAYPGCPEGRGFDECGEKGVYLVEVSEDGCRAEFVPTYQRRYEVLRVDVGADIAAQLPEGMERGVCRIVLTGECERAPDVRALEARLADRFFALEVRDATSIRRDVWEDAARDSLRGLFLRKLRARLDAAESEAERETITQAVRWGLAALDGGEAVEEV